MTEELLDVTGAAAPPRLNGELVFAAPWERRVFGLTMALVQSRVIEYEPFRQALIAEIGAWERSGQPEADWSYYRCWARALEKLLVDQRALNPTEVDTRTEVLGQRPHGHDHP